MPAVITLTGPSGSGKSTAARALLGLASASFRPVRVPKFVTRAPRGDDEGEAIAVSAIPSDCDLVYEQYGDRYGLRFATLFEHLQLGQTPIVILNDVRVVEDVRRKLGPAALCVFVFRKAPTESEYESLARQRKVLDTSAMNRRFTKAQAIYRIYIENIHLFDHVIINGGSRSQLVKQIRCIAKAASPLQLRPLR
jgi:guanylate kinase